MTIGTAHALVSLVLPAWLDWLKKNSLSSWSNILSNHHCQHLVIISHAQCSMPAYFLCWRVCRGLVIQRRHCSHDDTGLRVNKYGKADDNTNNPDMGQWWQLPFMRFWPLTARMLVHDYQLHQCTRIELQKYLGRYWSVMDAQKVLVRVKNK